MFRDGVDLDGENRMRKGRVEEMYKMFFGNNK